MLRFWGIDRTIAYTLFNRLWAMSSGVLTILMLGHFLSAEERGYYYTFTNVLGLGVLFELGMAFVILQFASHEKAKLHWSDKGILIGDVDSKSRLASLMRLALKWYAIIAILFLVLMLPSGLFFFDSYQSSSSVRVDWHWPWIVVVCIVACSLMVTPLFAVIQGCGLIREVALMRLIQAVISSVLFWLALLNHWRLLAMLIVPGVGLVTGLIWIASQQRHWLRDLMSVRGSALLNWRGEIWPLQWKIAVSWVSSYLIFQLFNPVLFAFHGAATAGQMGMSLSVMFSLAALSSSWLETKSVPFGDLIAKRDFVTLDKTFFPCLWQSFTVLLCLNVGFWLLDFALYFAHHPWGQRLIEPLPLALLLAATSVNHIYFSQAVYLRAHKQEPYLVTSVVGGTLIGLSTYFLGREFGALGMAFGYFAVSVLFWLPMGTWIFVQKRRLWHNLTFS